MSVDLSFFSLCGTKALTKIPSVSIIIRHSWCPYGGGIPGFFPRKSGVSLSQEEQYFLALAYYFEVILFDVSDWA